MKIFHHKAPEDDGYILNPLRVMNVYTAGSINASETMQYDVLEMFLFIYWPNDKYLQWFTERVSYI